jgi:hypothetical protein
MAHMGVGVQNSVRGTLENVRTPAWAARHVITVQHIARGGTKARSGRGCQAGGAVTPHSEQAGAKRSR